MRWHLNKYMIYYKWDARATCSEKCHTHVHTHTHTHTCSAPFRVSFACGRDIGGVLSFLCIVRCCQAFTPCSYFVLMTGGIIRSFTLLGTDQEQRTSSANQPSDMMSIILASSRLGCEKRTLRLDVMYRDMKPANIVLDGKMRGPQPEKGSCSKAAACTAPWSPSHDELR